jgi:hypothetical protein
MPRLIESGWAIPRGGKRAHYFIGTTPLCSSKARFAGMFQDRDDNKRLSGDCSGCWRVLDHRALKLEDVRVGVRVRVAKVIDSAGNANAVGRTGVIKRVQTRGIDCGESRTHPWITVRFDSLIINDEGRAVRLDHFWREELSAP